MLLLLSLLPACGTDGVPADSATTGNFTLNDAGEVTAASLGLETALSDHMATVIHVTWSQLEADVVYESLGIRRQPPGTATESGYEAWLIGTPEQTLTTVHLAAQVDGSEVVSEALEITTGDLGIEVPLDSVWANPTATLTPGLMLVSWLGGLPSGLALLDREGRPVWAITPQSEESSVMSAAWSADGLWTLEEHRDSQTAGLVRYELDGSVAEEFRADNAHHDLTLGPDGAVAWIETDARDTTTWGKVYGDRIVSRSADGAQTELVNTWDLLGDPTPSNTWDNNWYPDGLDWSHANGLSYSPSRDSYLLSLGGQALVMELDAPDMAVAWQIAGQELADTQARFELQHSPSWTPDDTVVFFVNFNGADRSSWAAEFDIVADPPKEIWNSGHGGDLATQALGRVARLEDGHTLVNYGIAGVLQEVNTDGESLWELSLTVDAVLGQMQLITLYDD